MKIQYGKKSGKPPSSFATVLEQERDETPTPTEVISSARSTDTSGFEMLPPPKRHARSGAISEGSARPTSALSIKDPETVDAGRASDSGLDFASRMANIRALTEDIRQRKGNDDDLLGALQLTFNKEQLKGVFPRRIMELEPLENSKNRRFAFDPNYTSHLLSVMTLTSDALNAFLQAAGSNRTFSYGSSKYYDGQSFEEVLYQEWYAQTIALNLERRLLDRIATAHRAISLFMASAEVVPG
jgi:hypothetical protein